MPRLATSVAACVIVACLPAPMAAQRRAAAGDFAGYGVLVRGDVVCIERKTPHTYTLVASKSVDATKRLLSAPPVKCELLEPALSGRGDDLWIFRSVDEGFMPHYATSWVERHPHWTKNVSTPYSVRGIFGVGANCGPLDCVCNLLSDQRIMESGPNFDASLEYRARVRVIPTGHRSVKVMVATNHRFRMPYPVGSLNVSHPKYPEVVLPDDSSQLDWTVTVFWFFGHNRETSEPVMLPGEPPPAEDSYYSAGRPVAAWEGHAWLHAETINGKLDEPFECCERDGSYFFVTRSGRALVARPVTSGRRKLEPLWGDPAWPITAVIQHADTSKMYCFARKVEKGDTHHAFFELADPPVAKSYDPATLKPNALAEPLGTLVKLAQLIPPAPAAK